MVKTTRGVAEAAQSVRRPDPSGHRGRRPDNYGCKAPAAHMKESCRMKYYMTSHIVYMSQLRYPASSSLSLLLKNRGSVGKVR